MTRIFIKSTIKARGEVGIKASRAAVLPGLLVLTFINLEPTALDLRNLEPLVLESPALGCTPLEPLEPLGLEFVLQELLVLAVLPLEQLLPASVLMEPLVLALLPLKPPVLTSVALEPLVLAFRNLEPLALGCINLKKLLVVRKDSRSSSPAGARSQIAQPWRSGIILPASSRFPRFKHETRDRQKVAAATPSG